MTVPRRGSGFSLIELMVVLAIAVVFVVMAAPLYTDVRERSIVRGAAGDLVAAVAQAKLEAAKRNDFVTVSVRGSGSAWCIGLQSGSTGCDCTGTCNISQVKTTELNGARLVAAANFGGTPQTDFTIDPRLGMLSPLTASGSVIVQSATDRWDYRIQFFLSGTAQTKLCAPSSPNAGKHNLSDLNC